jgi:hypothetical protein
LAETTIGPEQALLQQAFLEQAMEVRAVAEVQELDPGRANPE